MVEPMSTHRDNNFDAVRLVAALVVVIGHAWPLTGRHHPPELAGVPIFALSVYVFFSLSGYLIATSWLRDPRPVAFLARRAARIFPALVLVVAVSVVVIGPVATSLPLAEYFGASQTWAYLTNVSLVATYELPGVFSEHPRPVVNGVLWSLGPEFLCYLGVLAAGLAALLSRRRRRSRLAFTVPLIAAVALASTVLVVGAGLGNLEPTVTAMVFFAVGATLAVIGGVRLPTWGVVLVVPVWLACAFAAPATAPVLTWVAIPLLVVRLGSLSTPMVRRAGRWGDVSYGVYLWGFPTQQLVVQFLPAMPLWLDILIVVPLTLLVAFASWHVVEKRVMRVARRAVALPSPLATASAAQQA